MGLGQSHAMDALHIDTSSTQHPEAIDGFTDESGMTVVLGSLHKQKDSVPNFQMAMRISAEVKVVMGSTRMEFGDIAKLGPGAIIALNKRVSGAAGYCHQRSGDRTRPRMCH